MLGGEAASHTVHTWSTHIRPDTATRRRQWRSAIVVVCHGTLALRRLHRLFSSDNRNWLRCDRRFKDFGNGCCWRRRYVKLEFVAKISKIRRRSLMRQTRLGRRSEKVVHRCSRMSACRRVLPLVSWCVIQHDLCARSRQRWSTVVDGLTDGGVISWGSWAGQGNIGRKEVVEYGAMAYVRVVEQSSDLRCNVNDFSSLP